MRSYIEGKIGGEIETLLSHHFRYNKPEGGRDTLSVKVEVSRTTRHHKKGNIFRAEVTIPLPGQNTLRVEAEATDAHAALDSVRDELFMEVSKWKEKKITKMKSGARKFKSRLKKVNE